MKLFIITFFAVCCSTSQLFCNDAVRSTNLNELDELLEAIVKSPRYPGKNYRDTVLDGPFLEIPQFVALSKLVAETSIDPDSLMRLCESNFDKQVVLVYSLAGVNGDRYLDFGNLLIDRVKLKSFDNDLFVLGYLMPSNRTKWFFTSNFAEPQVRNLLEKVRAVFLNNSDVQSWLNDVFSGKLAERDRRLFAENLNLAKEVDSVGNVEDNFEQKNRSGNVPQSHTATQTADIAMPTKSTPSEEPSSSMPWSIIVVLIAAALGLLWLLLKRRS